MDRYTRWITEDALPLWAEAGFDRAGMRFRERLDADRRALDVPHRVMVQARQIYVYAHAAVLGWHEEGGLLAEAALASLLRDYRDRAGGMASFAFAVDPAGRRVSETRDAYAHAFVLFALAWLHRLNGDPHLLDIADETITFVEASLHDPRHGGVFDAHPATDRSKRQNPLMHLLEAYLALDTAAPGRGYVERARPIVALFRNRLFSDRHGVLLEHHAEDWSEHPEPSRRDVFEPGHHFEWVWLLREYGRRVGAGGDDRLDEWSARLHEAALGHGVLPAGLILDEVAADRTQRKRSHRVWPHTEAMKAAVARHAAGDAGAVPLAQRMAEVLREHFLDRPFRGGWTDQIDQAGRPLVAHVPASTLYHLMLAATELARDLAPGTRSSAPAIVL